MRLQRQKWSNIVDACMVNIFAATPQAFRAKLGNFCPLFKSYLYRMNNSFQISGHLVDIFNQRIYPATVHVLNGKIDSIRELSRAARTPAHFILPGFTDAHVHIESSMLIPAEFARLAVVQGTVSTISDPHEIANVCGIEGVRFMIENGQTVPFKFNFGAPSCVPATSFETAGAAIDAAATDILLQDPDILYLSEMMNFPGVLNGDAEVMAKIAAAKRLGKPVDGHAPGLRGEAAARYIAAGISTDHECFTAAEAMDKLKHGMKILIREGSAARNFDALVELLHEHSEHIMFCSDDKHPDSLLAGHINQLCARAIAKGIDLFKVLRAACVNPVLHYKTKTGLLREGDAADFILVNNCNDFFVQATYINGQLVAKGGETLIPRSNTRFTPVNKFSIGLKEPAEFRLPRTHEGPVAVIEALDGQLITNKLTWQTPGNAAEWAADLDNDILYITVVNRYQDATPAMAFIKNFGLKEGAIASSVAHDSHNIVAVGSSKDLLCRAVNLVIAAKGGVSCTGKYAEKVLPLPVGGLMSMADGYEVAADYTAIDAMAKALGSTLSAPFMTLSFMALLVIPHLKLSDLGLFDGDQFRLLGAQTGGV